MLLPPHTHLHTLYRPVQTTVVFSPLETTSLGPTKFWWPEPAEPVQCLWKPEGGGHARNTCCWQLAWKLCKCCNFVQQAAWNTRQHFIFSCFKSCVAMLAATHSSTNLLRRLFHYLFSFKPNSFKHNPPATVGKFDTLFPTGPLTLSKREPTFAVTSSTSVNVSMLTKTPPRRVWGTRQRRTSRPGRSDSRSRRLRRLCSASLRRDRQRSELPDMSAITWRRVRPECDWRRGSGSRHVPQPRSDPSSSRSWSVSQGYNPASSWLIGLVAS